ncbi:hypothetical protein GCM10011352_18310 [Marinobacterium zhoushanense]|uniref:SHOCT domain-containing protein n=1 Tax=Marinobacterium zhoushanense TaxID=1679163 RepID=A0ABQ1KDI5_9GAMM|nr:SHOCT domain-containing protein [Marinobacterium zhoushanense]GGB92590.1 hypothetical protein GCM10011352_18310 [Marinobacterium zhoushanense]
MMWGEWGQYGWGWMLFGGLHMLLFWLLIILGIAALVKWLWGAEEKGSNRRQDALDVLHERYARGEIDRETYLAMKQDILAGK